MFGRRFEERIVRYCSPTLAGIKTGSLFSCAYSSKTELDQAILQLDQKLTGKGVRVTALRIGTQRALIYVYRPSMLEKDVAFWKANGILSRCGYCHFTADHCVRYLIERLRKNPEFPHEIGLFLGYPAEDVQGFMENRGSAYKCAGVWKVYGNTAAAKEAFWRFRCCTDNYVQRMAKGNTIDQLTVADTELFAEKIYFPEF